MSTPQKSTVAIQTDEFAILDAIRRYAPEFGLSSTVAESYAIWTICFRRYCLQNGIPWLWMDSVSRFMDYLDQHDDVSKSERNRALDGIMFYLNDVRHAKDKEEGEATRQPSSGPKSTRSLFAQLLLRCDISITDALRLRVSNVQLAESRLRIPQSLRADPKETVELPPSLRRSMKRRVDRVQATAHDTDPLLFDPNASPREEEVDPEHSTQLATRVMNRLEGEEERGQASTQSEAASTSGESGASSTSNTSTSGARE